MPTCLILGMSYKHSGALAAAKEEFAYTKRKGNYGNDRC
jgi:hypothetical protein